MKNEVKSLEEKINKLEKDLAHSQDELIRYKSKVNLLNRQLENIISDISKQLQLSQKIQKLLSPTEIPRISGFDFSTKFIPGYLKGGNYFDIFEHQDKMKFSILLSSCSGFNISSLLLSILIKMSSLIETKTGNMPHVLIKSILNELKPYMSSQDEAHIFYAVVDRRNYEMHYCRVGNFQTYLQKFGFETLVSLDKCTSALCKDFSEVLESKTITLNPKDRLILLTSGILLNENANKIRWTEDELKDSIRKAPKRGAHELRNEILFKNESFLAKDTLDYDVTVLIAEVKDSVIKLAAE